MSERLQSLPFLHLSKFIIILANTCWFWIRMLGVWISSHLKNIQLCTIYACVCSECVHIYIFCRGILNTSGLLNGFWLHFFLCLLSQEITRTMSTVWLVSVQWVGLHCENSKLIPKWCRIHNLLHLRARGSSWKCCDWFNMHENLVLFSQRLWDFLRNSEETLEEAAADGVTYKINVRDKWVVTLCYVEQVLLWFCVFWVKVTHGCNIFGSIDLRFILGQKWICYIYWYIWTMMWLFRANINRVKSLFDI